MAKRYTRINWQNKPNTATPLSAANLNKMDKGIKDCDDAIGDLALLNTNNKIDLVSAVNELNNNLNNKANCINGTIAGGSSVTHPRGKNALIITGRSGSGADNFKSMTFYMQEWGTLLSLITASQVSVTVDGSNIKITNNGSSTCAYMILQ